LQPNRVKLILIFKGEKLVLDERFETLRDEYLRWSSFTANRLTNLEKQVKEIENRIKERESKGEKT
jgi:hypothetical protein